MNRTPLTTIAPEIFRKRLLIEGFFRGEVSPEILEHYFEHTTRSLGLRTYGPSIIHRTSGEGQAVNEGYDAFVPLIDSGIYIAVWVNPRFLSTIIYTCRAFDEDKAVIALDEVFGLESHQAAIF